MAHLLKSTGLFVLAGFAEIGGGYLVWLWLRDSRALWFGFADPVRRDCHVPVGAFWSRLRRLWRRVHTHGDVVGMGYRRRAARPLGRDQCNARVDRRRADDVRTT